LRLYAALQVIPWKKFRRAWLFMSGTQGCNWLLQELVDVNYTYVSTMYMQCSTTKLVLQTKPSKIKLQMDQEQWSETMIVKFSADNF